MNRGIGNNQVGNSQVGNNQVGNSVTVWRSRATFPAVASRGSYSVWKLRCVYLFTHTHPCLHFKRGYLGPRGGRPEGQRRGWKGSGGQITVPPSSARSPTNLNQSGSVELLSCLPIFNRAQRFPEGKGLLSCPSNGNQA